MLRQRPKRKMGVRAVERRWPRHYRFVKTFSCAVGGCRRDDIHVHHLRNAANSGVGLKPADIYTVPLCTIHHKQFHDIGIDSFQELHNRDLWEYAALLVSRTPDVKLREYLREHART